MMTMFHAVTSQRIPFGGRAVRFGESSPKPRVTERIAFKVTADEKKAIQAFMEERQVPSYRALWTQGKYAQPYGRTIANGDGDTVVFTMAPYQKREVKDLMQQFGIASQEELFTNALMLMKFACHVMRDNKGLGFDESGLIGSFKTTFGDMDFKREGGFFTLDPRFLPSALKRIYEGELAKKKGIPK